MSGINDDAVKGKEGDFGSLVNYVKTGKKDNGYNTQLNSLIDVVYKFYNKTKGESWSEKNRKEDLNKSNLLQYLRSIYMECP